MNAVSIKCDCCGEYFLLNEINDWGNFKVCELCDSQYVEQTDKEEAEYDYEY